MRLTFALRDPKRSTPTPLTCWVYWYRDGERVRWKIPTGLRIDPKRWDGAKVRAKRGTVEEADVNATLARITALVEAAFRDVGPSPTLDEARHRYGVLTGAIQERGRDVWSDYETYITDTPGFAPFTRRNHRSCRDHLQRFTERHGLELTYDTFNVLLWERLANDLLRIDRLTNPSAWNVLKSVKAFLAATFTKGLHTNDTFRRVTRRRLLPPSDSSDKPYLTHDELQRVAGIDLPDRLARVRDLFVFACYTGMRYGDLQALRPEHRQGDVLRFTTGKNRKVITVPLLREACDIWDRYGGTLPRLSNQKGNAYLQEALHVAAIDAPVVVVTYRGTERVEKTVPKWEAVGFHGAKRTFVTLSRQLGISPEALRRATGNTLKTLETYRLGTDEDAEAEIRRGWEAA